MRASQSAGDLAKKISVLDAIRWIGQSVKNIKPDCVKECFAACGRKHDGDIRWIENVEEIVEDTNDIEELVTEINSRCNVYDGITLDESVTTNAGLQPIDELVMEETAEVADAENEDGGIGIGKRQYQYWKKSLCGLIGGVYGVFVGVPTDVAMTRMAIYGRLPPEQRRNYWCVTDVLWRIFKEEGFMALFRGYSG
ncbi:Mitochondrial carrier protein [Popillia japonica]|uniref:Mitochondrial carrier protein n=1 Tax=Popillia japonica TaxID=7064 RepID=A0AAW1KIV2_POPJA